MNIEISQSITPAQQFTMPQTPPSESECSVPQNSSPSSYDDLLCVESGTEAYPDLPPTFVLSHWSSPPRSQEDARVTDEFTTLSSITPHRRRPSLPDAVIPGLQISNCLAGHPSTVPTKTLGREAPAPHGPRRRPAATCPGAAPDCLGPTRPSQYVSEAPRLLHG